LFVIELCFKKMNKNILNIAIIGCGVIAPSHIESFLNLNDVKIIALCDLVAEKCKKLNEKYMLNANVYTDFRELFLKEKLDAISVCTDHSSHAEICDEALQRKINVLCEKPLAHKEETLELILNSAKKNNNIVFSGVFQNRFNPLFKAIKQLLSHNAFGKIISAGIACSCLRTKEYYEADFWRGKWQTEGGSVMINQAIHYLDLLLWCCGKPKTVSAKIANLAHVGVIETEDVVASAIEFESGALATVSANSASYNQWHNALWLSGTEGFVFLNNSNVVEMKFKNQDMLSLFNQIVSNDDTEKLLSGKSYYGGFHFAQIKNFVDSIRTNTTPVVDLKSAALTVKTVLAIYKAMREGKSVDMNFSPLID